MNAYFKHIVLLLIFTPLLVSQNSCKKDNLEESKLNATSMRVYDVGGLKEVIEIVAGNDVALIVYNSFQEEYRFKLIDLEGNEIWDKSYSLNSGTSSQNQIEDVIHEDDNSFTVVYGRRLMRINYDGLLFEDIESFTDLSNSYTITSIEPNEKGNYLILGKAFLVGNRTYFGEYTRSGEEVFRDLFTVNVNGSNNFNSIIANEDGSYIIAGVFNTSSQNFNNQFFILEYSSTGERLAEHYYKVADYVNLPNETISGTTNSCTGFYRTANGNLILATNSFSSDENNQAALLFSINPSWEVENVQLLDLAPTNALGSSLSGVGEGIIKNPNGTFTGVVFESTLRDQSFFNEIPINFLEQEFSYFFDLDQNGKLTSMEYFDRNYANNFSNLCKLSNGKTAFAGVVLSFGEEFKLALILK